MFPLYFDEDTGDTGLVRALRQRGITVETTQGLNRKGLSDPEQLAFAASEGFTIVTANVGHYVALHSDYILASREHAGIICLSNQKVSVGRQLRGLVAIQQEHSAETMRNNLEFLLNWA